MPKIPPHALGKEDMNVVGILGGKALRETREDGEM